MIQELDRVELTRDLPEKKLKAGDLGTVVAVYAGGADTKVEIMTYDGQNFTLETLRRADLRPARSQGAVSGMA